MKLQEFFLLEAEDDEKEICPSCYADVDPGVKVCPKCKKPMPESDSSDDSSEEESDLDEPLSKDFAIKNDDKKGQIMPVPQAKHTLKKVRSLRSKEADALNQARIERGLEPHPDKKETTPEWETKHHIKKMQHVFKLMLRYAEDVMGRDGKEHQTYMKAIRAQERFHKSGKDLDKMQQTHWALALIASNDFTKAVNNLYKNDPKGYKEMFNELGITAEDIDEFARLAKSKLSNITYKGKVVTNPWRGVKNSWTQGSEDDDGT